MPALDKWAATCSTYFRSSPAKESAASYSRFEAFFFGPICLPGLSAHPILLLKPNPPLNLVQLRQVLALVIELGRSRIGMIRLILSRFERAAVTEESIQAPHFLTLLCPICN